MKRVLVVEEDADLGELLALVLGMSRYAVEVGECGMEALGKIRHRAPDALVVDAGIPATAAWEFVEASRDELAALGVPLVLLVDRPSDEPFAGGPRPVEFLGRPFEPGDLLAAVARATGQAEGRDAVG